MILAAAIDHTLLKPEATQAQIKTLCDEARQHQFKAVCVNPSHVAFAAGTLQGCQTLVCTVVGFPLGANTSASKAFETNEAIALGAKEIDMVLNIGALKAKLDDVVLNDIKAVVTAANGTTVKVILETALLNEEEIARACQLATKAKANFVKTSTGFSTRGASLRDIEIMKANISSDMKIKASGGIRSLEDAKAYIAAGVHRLGTSSGVAIIQGLNSDATY